MRQVLKGSTNVSEDIYIIDSTDGTPETGVVFNTSGIDLKYRRDGAAVVSITEVTLAALTTAHADGGFLTIGNGVYRLDVPDAAYTTGASKVTIFGTVTGMIVLPITIQLVDFDPEDGVRLGLTALPNAAADAAGGVPISDAGGLDLDLKLANTNEVTAARMGALTDWINGGRLDLIIDAINVIAADWTDAGRLDVLLDAIKAITDALPDSGALTTLQADTDNIQTRLPAALVGGRMDSDIGAKTGNVALSTQEKTDVNAEVDTALATTTYAEPAQGAPGNTISIEEKISFIYAALINKIDVDATLKEFNNAAGTVIWKKTVADDGTNYNEAKGVTGP